MSCRITLHEASYLKYIKSEEHKNTEEEKQDVNYAKKYYILLLIKKVI